MKNTLIVLGLLFSIVAKAQWQINNLNTAEVHCIAAQDSFVCVGSNSFMYTSLDNGSTWLANNNGLPNASFLDVVILNSTIFAGTLAGVYLSTNNGNSWISANLGLTDSVIFTLAKSGTNVIAGTNHGGVFLYNNGTWNSIGVGLSNHSVYSLVSDGTTIYAGCDSGQVYKSINYGSWTLVNIGLPSSMVSSLCMSGNTVLATLSNNGVYSSSNNGGLWSYSSAGLPNNKVYTLASNGNNIFVGTDSGIYYSNDVGNIWHDLNTGVSAISTSLVRAIAVGNYKIFISLSSSLPFNQLWDLLISEITEIDERINLMNFIHYPNPAQDQLNILFNDATATEAFIEIHDLLGKLIERVPLKSGVAYNYNTQLLQKSIYLVSLYINGKLVDNQKLVLIK